MALPMLRGCYRVPSTFSFTRLFLSEGVILNRCAKTRLPSSPHAALTAAVRPYSSDPGGQKQHQNMMVLGVPNLFILFRTKIYFFLIRAYFDKEFSIQEFTEGAKQAFCHVSRLLSRCQFEALEGLVAEDLIAKLQEKCSLLPSSHKKALSADFDDIMYTTTGDVGIYYDDNGRKFVSILMRFWYLTSARIPEDGLKGTRVFQVSFGSEQNPETKTLLTANYEFQREFTQGVAPDWTITRIEYSRLLD
ncbi:m-AAA protease-interacting protein 1, mitochondrial [Acanthopagrus latus]|uniref:m-AAA protease-interacting protein 1, mitochondrial n=1 Tax=Acanthopagrus latus TaxID=8177 RepID=UPI00187CE690|nr:m-AAA protease-interacting protein 1, mitochondrial [Acanthopagrus latus]